MKPCVSVCCLLRLCVLGERVKRLVARALRWRSAWPELSRDYLQDARTWGRLLKVFTAAFVATEEQTCAWLNARQQSALEVVL